MTRAALIALLLLASATSPQPARTAGRPLMAILQAELQRNVDGLKKQDAAPYILSYTVHDVHTSRIASSFGALQHSDDSRARLASIDVRVGDYAFDDTHPVKG